MAAGALILSMMACAADEPKTREPSSSGEETTPEDEQDLSDGDNGPSSSGTDVDVFSLHVGDCIDTTHESSDNGEFETVHVVSCDDPHDGELFYSHIMDGEPGAEFPGDDVVGSEIERICMGEAFEDYVGVPYLESELWLSALFPIEGSWDNLDDREILCFIVTEEFVTGSLEGSQR